jgi:hypothetical protein
MLKNSARSVAKYSHPVLAGFMAIWLSGLVVLLACHTPTVHAMADCPLAKFGVKCDKVDKNKDLQVITNENGNPGFDCCAFIPAFFEKSRSFYGKQQYSAAAASSTIVVLRGRAPVASRFAVVVSASHVVLPKNDTYLKNRTFRI